MTPKQLQDARIKEALRRSFDTGCGLSPAEKAIAVYLDIEREGWTPEVKVDEALQCWNAVMNEYHKARPYRQAPNCLGIIRIALDKARAAGDADLRARLERADEMIARINVASRYGNAFFGSEARAILAKRDAPEMSGYADGDM